MFYASKRVALNRLIVLLATRGYLDVGQSTEAHPFQFRCGSEIGGSLFLETNKACNDSTTQADRTYGYATHTNQRGALLLERK